MSLPCRIKTQGGDRLSQKRPFLAECCTLEAGWFETPAKKLHVKSWSVGQTDTQADTCPPIHMWTVKIFYSLVWYISLHFAHSVSEGLLEWLICLKYNTKSATIFKNCTKKLSLKHFLWWVVPWKMFLNLLSRFFVKVAVTEEFVVPVRHLKPTGNDKNSKRNHSTREKRF